MFVQARHLPKFPLAREKMLRLLPLAFLGLLALVAHASSWVYPGFWPGSWIGQACLILLAVRLRPRDAFLGGLLIGTLGIIWAFYWAPQALEALCTASWWIAYPVFF